MYSTGTTFSVRSKRSCLTNEAKNFETFLKTGDQAYLRSSTYKSLVEVEAQILLFCCKMNYLIKCFSISSLLRQDFEEAIMERDVVERA